MRHRNFWSFIKGILFIQLFLLAIIAGLTVDLNAGFNKTIDQFSSPDLFLPFSTLQIDQRQSELLVQESSLLLTGGADLMKQLGVNELQADNMAVTMVGSQIQALASTDAEAGEDESVTAPEQDKPAVKQRDHDDLDSVATIDPELLKGHTVYLYCTHSAESYIPDSGKARLDGKRGLINAVAASMEGDLQAKGLKTQFINTIHDYPDYNTSYTNSRLSVKKIIQSNEDIVGLFDIHRDSIPGTKEAATVEIEGKKSACILIVVGSDARKPHPNWQKNYNFAQRLYKQGEKMYPGLIKGVRTKAGTYNQEFHPRALLLEFGSDYNTLEEATYAAYLFAEVFIQVLKEDVLQQ